MEEKKWIDVGPIWSHRYFLDRKGRYQNIKGCENWEMTGHWFSNRCRSYVQYKREKNTGEPDTSELKWIQVEKFTSCSEVQDLGLEGCDDFEVTHNWFKEEDRYYVEFKRKETTQKKLICVGPIWSHKNFLARQDEFKNIQGCEEIFNWKLTGHWFSKNGKSYVGYEREKEDGLEDYSETKWVNVGPIWSHRDFLNRWGKFADFEGCEGFEMTGHWFSEGGTSFVHYEKMRPESRCKRSIGLENNYYEDPAFQIDTALKGLKNLSNVVWKRPHEIVDNPKMYLADASKNDINQGQLGNCWFLAPLAILCQHDELLKRVCPDQTLDPSDEDYDGLIKIRFWQYGEWIEVIVDDRLPYNKSTGQLYFADSDTKNEFWAALIEKAYAKLHLSYNSLVSGRGSEAMMDLTGGFSKFYSSGNYSDKECFDFLKDSLDDGALITVSTLSEDDDKWKTITQESIVPSHAYTLTRVDVLNFGGENKLCVRIRNPWGNTTEWTGELNDSDDIWDECLTTVSCREKGDGEFWMTISDFMKRFRGFYICWLDKSDFLNSEGRWIERTLEGEWCIDQGTAGGCANHKDTHFNNPFMTFTVTGGKDSNECIFSLQHKYRRILEKHEGQNLDDFKIGYTVYKMNADFDSDSENPTLKELLDNSYWVTDVRFTSKRDIVNKTSLRGAGRYIVVPSTYKQYQEGEFYLRVYVEKEDFCKK